MKTILLALVLAGTPLPSLGMVRVVTTLPDLAVLTQEIGGNRVTVQSIVRGNQNPHVVEVKPSYMIKLKSADIFLMIGMELEMWAPQIIDGSRNERLDVVDLSTSIEKLEVPTRVDRSQGDVHRFGNPHYWLDPRNIRPMVETILSSLRKASPNDEAFFRSNADAYLARLDTKIRQWETTMKPYAGTRIITFHRSWSYFARWLGLIVADQVEPNPGIPPSPSHTADLLRLVRESSIKAIIVEPFYDTSAPDQIARATGASVVQLSTSVGGVKEATDYIALMDYNITTLSRVLR